MGGSIVWWIYWREIIGIVTLFLSLGAILHFSKKNDLDLLFRGFSIAFCAKKIFLGTFCILLFILASWGIFWLAKAPIDSPFGALNSGLSVLLYHVNDLISTDPLFSQESYQNALERWQTFLTQCTQLKSWDILALTLVILFLLSYYGGVIARLAVVEVATGNVPSLKTARLFVRNRFSSYLGPLFLVVGGIFFLSGTNALMGFFGAFTNTALQFLGFEQSKIGYSLLALALPLMMVLSFIVMMLILGTILAFFFFQTSASTEGGDFFDTFSRAFSYFFARPWMYFFYNLVAWIYGAILLTLVSLMALCLLLITFKTASFGFHCWSTESFTQAFLNQIATPRWEPHQIFFSAIVFLYATALGGLWISYLYSTQLCICLLIRKSYDLIDIKNIYLEEEPIYELARSGFVSLAPSPTIEVAPNEGTPLSPEPKEPILSTPIQISTPVVQPSKSDVSSSPRTSNTVETPRPASLETPIKETVTESNRIETNKTEASTPKLKAPIILAPKSYPKKPSHKKKKK